VPSLKESFQKKGKEMCRVVLEGAPEDKGVVLEEIRRMTHGFFRKEAILGRDVVSLPGGWKCQELQEILPEEDFGVTFVPFPSGGSVDQGLIDKHAA